jgi:hypothetical protein
VELRILLLTVDYVERICFIVIPINGVVGVEIEGCVLGGRRSRSV